MCGIQCAAHWPPDFAGKLIELEYAGIEDRKVRSQLRSATDLEVKVRKTYRWLASGCQHTLGSVYISLGWERQLRPATDLEVKVRNDGLRLVATTPIRSVEAAGSASCGPATDWRSGPVNVNVNVSRS